MKTLITALVYILPESYRRDRDYLLGMLKLWTEHLRGPGRYTGDIRLYTNADDVNHPEVTVRPFQRMSDDVKEVFMQRVLNYRDLQTADYDSILNLDLDILAVNDVAPLFARDEKLWCAESLMATAHPRHAGHLMSMPQRLWSQYISSTGRRSGLNCCAFSSTSVHWETNMGGWARIIDELGGSKAHLPQDDQTALNYAYYYKRLNIEKYPSEWVQHKQWYQGTETKLWHFPTDDRLNVMRRMSLCGN